MPAIKRVIDYSGLNYYQTLELPVDTFLLMVRNSIISEYESTEEGREFLKQCKRLKQEEPDEQAILREIKKQMR